MLSSLNDCRTKATTYTVIDAFILCELGSFLFKSDEPEKASLMFGLGMNNNGTGLVLAATALTDHPAVMLPMIFYTLVQQMVAAVVDRRRISLARLMAEQLSGRLETQLHMLPNITRQSVKFISPGHTRYVQSGRGIMNKRQVIVTIAGVLIAAGPGILMSGSPGLINSGPPNMVVLEQVPASFGMLYTLFCIVVLLTTGALCWFLRIRR